MELHDVFRLPNIILRYTPNRQIPIIMMQFIEPNAFFSPIQTVFAWSKGPITQEPLENKDESKPRTKGLFPVEINPLEAGQSKEYLFFPCFSRAPTHRNLVDFWNSRLRKR